MLGRGDKPARARVADGAGTIALGSVAAACALALIEARQSSAIPGPVRRHPHRDPTAHGAEAWPLATLGAPLAVAIGLAPDPVQTLASWHVRPCLAILVCPSPLAVPWTLLAAVTSAFRPSRRQPLASSAHSPVRELAALAT
jgi:hypothetical protein